MNVVADTSILLAVALDEPDKERIIRLTAGVNAVAPEIMPYEAGNALSAMVKRGRITRHDAAAALAIVTRIPIRLVQVDIAQALNLAMECNLYAYDAYFLQCARSLGCPLLTLDRGMRRVATDLGIECLE